MRVFLPTLTISPPGDEHGGDMTFAVRVECTICGHLMLFNAQKYRTGDEITMREQAEEGERQLGEWLPPDQPPR